MEYYHHSTPLKGQPRITVAGILSNGTLTLGVSRCSNKDQFSKKKGRHIALGRAKTKPAIVLSVPADQIVGRIFLEESRKLIGEAFVNPQAVHPSVIELHSTKRGGVIQMLTNLLRGK